MQTFTANLFQLAVLGAGISLLTIWAKHLQEIRQGVASFDEKRRSTDRRDNSSTEEE